MNKVTNVVLAAILAFTAAVPAGLQAETNRSDLPQASSSPVGTSYDLLGPKEGKGQAAGQADGADDSQPAESSEPSDRPAATAAPNESAVDSGGPAKAEQKPSYMIYFTASWCGPCQGYKPTVHKIRDEGLIKVHEVDIDNNPGAASQWGITSVPTTIIVKDGKVVARHNRPVPYSTLKGEISP
jgi:thioredoxin 1